MFRAFRAIVSRDLVLAMRRRSDVFSTLFFFVIVVSLFPLGIGPEMNTLRLIAPGVVWVAALLASMLALERLFAADHQDGCLEQMLLTPQPLFLLVLGKVVAHWLVTGLPLVLMAPL
ncbi:MAG: heme exporter protein CcmB, partial [Gammaproteobacteria bacterium]|nr:heme exporter protein CcmB [Gammaproteobacteria bacterium]